MLNFKSSLLFFSQVLLLLSTVYSNDDLDKFVREKLANYSSWLRNNNLDPSSPEVGITRILRPPPGGNLVVNNLECFITEMTVRGHSNIESYDVNYVDLIYGGLGVRILYNNVTFYGRYSAAGIVFSSKPTSGQGNFSITFPHDFHNYWEIDLQINATNYLSITNRQSWYNVGLGGSKDTEVHFEDLFNNADLTGFEDYMRSELIDAFFSHEVYLSDDIPLNVLQSSLLQYLQEIFDTTPLSDIISPARPLLSRESDFLKDGTLKLPGKRYMPID